MTKNEDFSVGHPKSPRTTPLLSIQSGRDCYMLLPLHTNPIFYHGLIVSTGKIKQIHIISVDWICKMSHLFQDVLGKPSRPRIPAHDTCNFIYAPSKCLSGSVLPVLLCQPKGQCQIYTLSFICVSSFETYTHFTTSPGPFGIRLPF